MDNSLFFNQYGILKKIKGGQDTIFLKKLKMFNSIEIYNSNSPIFNDRLKFNNFNEKDKIVFINLKAAPTIYINDELYRFKYTEPYINTYSYRTIENFEEKLKNELLKLSTIEIRENEEKKIITIKKIYTIKDIFSDKKIDYYRIPLSKSVELYKTNFFNLKHILLRNIKNKIIFSSAYSESKIFFTHIFSLITFKDYLNKNIKLLNYNEILKMQNELRNENLFQFDNENIANKILVGKYKIIQIISKIIGRNIKVCVDSLIFNYIEQKDNIFLFLISNLDFYLKTKKERYLMKAYKLMKYYIYLLLYESYTYSNYYTFIEYVQSEYLIFNFLKNFEGEKNIKRIFFPLTISLKNNGVFINDLYKKGTYDVFVNIHRSYGNIIQYKNIILLENPIKTDCFFGTVINLRSEPSLYIKNKLYYLRDIENIDKAPPFYSEMGTFEIENLENYLKNKILKISQSELLLFNIEKNREIKQIKMYNLNEENIKTPKEYFYFQNIKYFRFPVSYNFIGPKYFDDFAKIIDLNFSTDFNEIYFHSNIKSIRARIFSIFYLIYIKKKRGEKIKQLEVPIQYEPIRKLIRMLNDGHDYLNEVVYFFSIFFRSTANDFLKKLRSFDFHYIMKAYLLLICYNYYISNGKYRYKSFTEWFNAKDCFTDLFKNLNRFSNADLQILTTGEKKNEIEILRNRKGIVLNKMCIIFKDHFTSLVRIYNFTKIPGIYNFRYVKYNELIICGCSMPYEHGIENTKRTLQEYFSGDILWFNMREEPVVYLDGVPFTVRYYSSPIENIETRGITKRRVLKMEKQLKKDILNERSENGLFITLEEGEDIFERENYEDYYLINRPKEKDGISKYFHIKRVETTEEMFSKYNINFDRFPITDEHFPFPKIIDELLKQIRNFKKNQTVIFNCLMGKGRTTTGMILTYLYNYSKDGYRGDNLKSYQPKFLLIDLLIKILPNGSAAKKIIDHIINKMDALENFREIIFTIYESKPERAIQFLERYFYLICLSEMFLEKIDSFVEFLKQHKEIYDLISRIGEIGFKLV